MNEQKKTVREWLNELPEPIRTRAVKNYDESFCEDKYAVSVKSAVNYAFDWDKSIEGNQYWANVYIGEYSEACALLGETLQTEQIESDNENELLDSLLDTIANEEFGALGWFLLNPYQKISLVKKVAIRYAELVNNQKQ